MHVKDVFCVDMKKTINRCNKKASKQVRNYKEKVDNEGNTQKMM